MSNIKMESISNVVVLGGGNLGSQIAFQTAYKGFDVVIYDINFEVFSKTMEFLSLLKRMYLKYDPSCSPEELDNALNRINFSIDLAEAVADADLVIESVPENIDIKKELYSNLAQVAPEKTIFATNSSTFLLRDLVDFTGRPHKFLALHFANALFRFNIAEIMVTPKTDPQAQKAVVNFSEQIGMVPIELKKENSGYILNALLIPLLTSASMLYMKGIADIETIDKTWRISTGSPAGPFEIFDVVGLNTIYNIACNGDANAKFFAYFLKKNYIDLGKLGLFEGEGFYKY